MKKLALITLTIATLWSCGTIKNSHTMNLKTLHTQEKDVQTQLLFEPTDEKVISLQIEKNKSLEEHVSKVPAFLVCVSGKAVYSDEKGTKETLQAGDYVFIEANVKHQVDALKKSHFLLIK
ncbi:cupin domain-containing protein [Pareuzebyella sediminis]|jgi:quercetin dioxygenase-like cupin family protein|uniref:cupin domain-containing protein n=1 Tax=Pareuzebyella sediminis TaxID=2607998 RepID=UPI001E47198B|nr:cupin domain-containing protein [Pareuzebyella sediminis]